jgi:hypothetical protein
MSNPTKMYCLPLAEYLEDLIRHHEYAVIDKVRAERLRFNDPSEELCHIEPGDSELVQYIGLGKNPAIFYLFHKKEWLKSYPRWKQRRLVAEADRQKSFRKAEVIKRLNAAIQAKTGVNDPEVLSKFVSMCVMQMAMLKEFGLTEEEVAILKE